MTALAVLSGGLREPSSTRLLADRIDAAVHAALQRTGSPASSTAVDLRPLGRPIMDAMLSGFASPELEAAFQTLADADGLIAVTPAFNASFSGLFKSFFDVLPHETLSSMPVLIAATGGTERHSLVLEHALRPTFSYLHAIVSPPPVSTPPPPTSAARQAPPALHPRWPKRASTTPSRPAFENASQRWIGRSGASTTAPMVGRFLAVRSSLMNGWRPIQRLS